jgi:uncharacterized integral membrane protein
MRIVTWTIRLAVFLFLVALAARNTDPVTVRFYFDLALQAPLIVVLFAAFAAGAAFGVLALLATLLRQRRQIAALKKKVPPEEPAEPPSLAGL